MVESPALGRQAETAWRLQLAARLDPQSPCCCARQRGASPRCRAVEVRVNLFKHPVPWPPGSCLAAWKRDLQRNPKRHGQPQQTTHAVPGSRVRSPVGGPRTSEVRVASRKTLRRSGPLRLTLRQPQGEGSQKPPHAFGRECHESRPYDCRAPTGISVPFAGALRCPAVRPPTSGRAAKVFACLGANPRQSPSLRGTPAPRCRG